MGLERVYKHCIGFLMMLHSSVPLDVQFICNACLSMININYMIAGNNNGLTMEFALKVELMANVYCLVTNKPSKRHKFTIMSLKTYRRRVIQRVQVLASVLGIAIPDPFSQSRDPGWRNL